MMVRPSLLEAVRIADHFKPVPGTSLTEQIYESLVRVATLYGWPLESLASDEAPH